MQKTGESDYSPPQSKPRIYTVSSLTEEIRQLVEGHFDFVWVEGEISNFRAPSSGHYYMSLKDEKAQIRAVMFRLQARFLKFIPEDGMRVIVQGRLGIYEPRGEYQIVLDYLEPLGVGALALALEQLKRKLAGQGLFDPEIKKPLPYLPQKVAVITSPTGAAIRDFLRVIHRRFPNIEVIVVPVKVQGDEAAAEIVEALQFVNQTLPVDVIVLTRGGGSLEDLWAFNQEEVALAIRASGIPVVSAVGHEIDVTISDLAADLRAPTPSAAAELLVVEKHLLVERLREMGQRLGTGQNALLEDLKRRVRLLAKGLRDPRRRLADLWLRLDELDERLHRSLRLTIREKRNLLDSGARALMLNAPTHRIEALAQRLEFRMRSLIFLIARRIKDLSMGLSLKSQRLKDVSPMTILARGYSITRRVPEGTILKSASGVARGERVRVTLTRGELECVVDKVMD
ncbi:MAG: exodeoxyribonuclease VII large subunit [Thermodesulfobacteriota bacterium]